jgi:hypothetical protein
MQIHIEDNPGAGYEQEENLPSDVSIDLEHNNGDSDASDYEDRIN